MAIGTKVLELLKSIFNDEMIITTNFLFLKILFSYINYLDFKTISFYYLNFSQHTVHIGFRNRIH